MLADILLTVSLSVMVCCLMYNILNDNDDDD